MKIKTVVKDAHDTSVSKGFYDCPHCKDIEDKELKCPECKGTGINQDKNIPEMLMLIVSELGEALEALRNNKTMSNIHGEEDIFSSIKNRVENYVEHNRGSLFIELFEINIKDIFEDEIADAIIRLLDLCGYMGIDIEKHIEAKMEYNKLRPYKHGKKF